jgi:hypothetical protein
VDISDVQLVEWADCLAGSADGGVLEHMGKADKAPVMMVTLSFNLISLSSVVDLKHGAASDHVHFQPKNIPNDRFS